jgi:HK97 gp10 family phage protein
MIKIIIKTDAMKTARYFDSLAIKVPARVSVLVDKGALKLQRKIKSNVPVITGALRDSITIENSSPSVFIYQAEIYSELYYAPYVEFGAQGRPPKPFFRPAIAEFENEFIVNIGSVVA